MKQKLEKYINYELNNIKNWGSDPNQVCTRCYGAVMFVTNFYCNPEEGDEIAKWWNDEIHPKFRELGAY